MERLRDFSFKITSNVFGGIFFKLLKGLKETENERPSLYLIVILMMKMFFHYTSRFLLNPSESTRFLQISTECS